MHLRVDVGGVGHPAWEQHSAPTGRIAAEAAVFLVRVVNVAISAAHDLTAGGVVELVGTQDAAVPVVSAVRPVDAVGLDGPVVVVGACGHVVANCVVGGLCEVLPESVWPHRRGRDLGKSDR